MTDTNIYNSTHNTNMNNQNQKLECRACGAKYSKEGHVFNCKTCFNEVCDSCIKRKHDKDCYMLPSSHYGMERFL